MLAVIKSELYTIIKRRSTWVMSLLILIPFLWFVNASYKNLYIRLEDNLISVSEDKKAVETLDVDYDFGNDIVEVRGILSVITPENSLNNSLMVFLGIGLLFIPIVGAISIGNEFSNSEIYRKKVEFGYTKVMYAKLIILSGYIFLLTMISQIIAICISNIHYSSKSDLIDRAISFAGNVDIKTNYNIIWIALLAIIFYTMIAFTIAIIVKNSIAGIVCTILISYGEAYIKNAFLPRWIFYNLFNKNSHTYEYSPAKFNTPANIADFGTMISILLIGLYIICLVLLSRRATKA